MPTFQCVGRFCCPLPLHLNSLIHMPYDESNVKRRLLGGGGRNSTKCPMTEQQRVRSIIIVLSTGG